MALSVTAGEADGEGDADAVGVGDADGVAEAFGDADAEADGDADADALAAALADAVVGSLLLPSVVRDVDDAEVVGAEVEPDVEAAPDVLASAPSGPPRNSVPTSAPAAAAAATVPPMALDEADPTSARNTDMRSVFPPNGA